ncbi:MAG: hypothetical protein FJ387_18660 [Verrucomicrobia bacterium]|nr:hypothetical protein [Verrucomicrobiota bacterium]
MSLHSSRTHLATLTRGLLNHWDQAKTHWQDQPSRAFEAKYLAPLTVQLTATLAAIDKLAQLDRQLRHDCQ